MAERTTAFSDPSLPERYERLLGAPLFAPWAEVLLDAVGVRAGTRLLDVAAGTGILSRAAARRAGASGHVLATDISPAMIDFLRSHPAEVGAAPIDTVIAPAAALPGGDYDAVTCQQGMPFFPDRPAAVAEMRRVLRPGGVVGIAVWTPGHDVVPFGPMNRALEQLGVPEPMPGTYDPDSFVVSAEQVADMLAAAGCTAIDSREVELVTHWPSPGALADAIYGTPFGGAFAALPEADRAKGRDLMIDWYRPWQQPDGAVAVPTYSVIARGTA
jgi:SAM-dependent methyltransferase